MYQTIVQAVLGHAECASDHMPFNMNTFHEMWGVNTPAEAEAIIEKQRQEIAGEPQNLEEQAISLIGRDIYEKLVKGYTEKQWGRDCKDLPAFIIQRLPVRMRYDNNYFNHPYQGIPIDAYFNYEYGNLQFRSLRFETETLDVKNYQGVAGMNFTDRETPYTRIVEHKHFEFGEQEKTVITREYSVEWKPGMEPYYPVNDDANSKLYEKYRALADQESSVIFGGRLAEY